MDSERRSEDEVHFAEVKESLAGYWIVDASEDRAIEIASRVVAFIEFPMEVRQIMHGSPDRDQAE